MRVEQQPHPLVEGGGFGSQHVVLLSPLRIRLVSLLAALPGVVLNVVVVMPLVL